MRTSKRAFKFFGDILPPKVFERPVYKKEDTDEVCRILAKECGIYHKPLTIKGEKGVTD